MYGKMLKIFLNYIYLIIMIISITRLEKNEKAKVFME